MLLHNLLPIFVLEVGCRWTAFGKPSIGQEVRYGRNGYCPVNSECLPISSCPILSDIVNYECVVSRSTDKLGCGYQGSGLVCCPQTTQYSTTVGHSGCGIPAVQGQNFDGIGAQPWVAQIGFRNYHTGEMKYPCAGSILNRRVVLTSAHCALAKSSNFKVFSVRVGEWLTNSDIDCGGEFCGLPVQDISISQVVVHPDFQENTYKDDIALVLLRTPINYTVTAQPICLPDSWNTVYSNDAILVGWGKTSGQYETPYRQQVLKFPIAMLQKCINYFGRTLPVTESNICAGGEGQDACSGFGGSPLIQKGQGRYYQVGILSFGSDQCGASDVPTVFVNLRKYVDWIKANIPNFYN